LSLAVTAGVLLGAYGLLLSLRRDATPDPFDPAPSPVIESLPEPERLPRRANFEPAAATSMRAQIERTAQLSVTLHGRLPTAPDAGMGAFSGDTRTLVAWVPATAFQGSDDLHTVALRVPAGRALALHWAANADAAARSYWSATHVAPIDEEAAAELSVGRRPVRLEVTTDGTAANAGALLRIERHGDRAWRSRTGERLLTDENGSLVLELGDGTYEVRSAFDEAAEPVSFTIPGTAEVRLTIPAPGVRAARS
jgi:hypothetical protein